MPLWLRRSLIALAVLVALVVAALAWLVASFDANRYKGLLIDWMRENKQRTLVIDGPIGLAVFPRLEVTLAGVRLSEHRRADEFMALDEASLAVQVMPLLRQQLAVDRIAARGVRVNYLRDAKGQSNIDDLLGSAQQKAPPDPASAPAQSLSLDVSAIELKDLQATVKDATLGLAGRFSVQELSTGRLADGSESPLRFKGRAQLTEPALDASVELSGLLKLLLPSGAPASLALRDMKLALQGEGFKVKQLDARASGALAYDGASGALRADGLQIGFSGERLGMVSKDSSVALASLRFQPKERTLMLEKLDLKLAGKSGTSGFSAALAWPRLEVKGDRLEGSPLKGSASLQGVQAIDIQFSSQAPTGSFERIRVPGLELTVKGSGGGRSVNGQARTDLTLAPQPLAASLDALTLRLAFTDPALPPMNLAVQGQARASDKDASWRLEGGINEQAFSLSGKADLSRKLPYVEAEARFAALDLTRFVAAPAKAEKPAAPDAKPTDAAAIDLGALRSFDGRLNLRAASLVYPPYRIADAALDATLASGLLRVSQLSGKAWSGRFTAQGTAEAADQPADQRLSVKLDASDVNIAQLLGDVAQFKKLEGTGRVSADLATRGAAVDAFKQQLAGKASVQLRDGAVRGINLAKVLRQWRSAVTLNQDAVQAASAEEKTDFSEISASFDVKDGVARSKDLAAKSPFVRVGGEGLVDIGRGRVDYLARATVTGSSEGQGGAELEALKGVTVPVQLVGPFEAVDYKVQWSAVSGDLLKGAAQKALNERARGALGGLLGVPAAPASGASAPTPKEQLKDKAAEQLKKLFGR